MSNFRSTGDEDESEPAGQFSDDSNQRVARPLVEGSFESELAARQFDIDAVFETLMDPGRRYVLTYLLQATDTVSLSELVDYAESQVEGGVSNSFRRDITIELTHVTLPKLADLGFIEYDMERQRLERTEQTAVVEPYLRVALAQQELAAERLDG